MPEPQRADRPGRHTWLVARRLRRGVYRLWVLSAEGFPIYLAVTRDGRRIAERVRYPLDTQSEIVESLYRTLDTYEGKAPNHD